MAWLLLFTILVAAPFSAIGTPVGATVKSCDSMKPLHQNIGSQTSQAPYTVTVSKTKIRPGETVEVTIKGKTASDKFSGYMLQGRIGNLPVGAFTVSQDKANTLDCKGKQVILCHHHIHS